MPMIMQNDFGEGSKTRKWWRMILPDTYRHPQRWGVDKNVMNIVTQIYRHPDLHPGDVYKKHCGDKHYQNLPSSSSSLRCW